jgi:hypothetical protein
MNTKPIVLHLILQELKYTQLISGLRNIGFDTQLHTISLLEVILLLMNAPKQPEAVFPEVSDKLGGVYDSFVKKAEKYPVSYTGEELQPLAEQCYQALVAQVHLQSRG